MKATATLRHEHDVIRQGLAVLDAYAARVAAGQVPPAADIGGLLDFFTDFADGCHHVKEETMLFPALAAAGLPRSDGPVGLLLEQHEQGRHLVAHLKDAAPDLAQDAAARRRFADAAREYVAMLEAHIAMENDAVFPTADGMLSEERNRELTAAFDRHEQEEMGADVHGRFHRMLDDLARRYLAGGPGAAVTTRS